MKNKKTYFKQITALTLTAVMTCSATSFRSMAADQQVSDNSTVQATVTAQIASSWISSIPNTIEIDAGEQKGHYEVSATGDISGDGNISINPDSSFKLSQAGKDDITANVTQSKTVFTNADLHNSDENARKGSGTIDVSDTLTAGKWSGTLNFDISYAQLNGIDMTKVVGKMKNLKVYLAGDSIIEGYGNDYKGVADYLTGNYGVRNSNIKDYSTSGAYITNKAPDNVVTPIQKQIGNMLARVNASSTENENSVIIFDGGGNDVLNYATQGITMTNSGDADSDILSAFSNCVGAISSAQSAKGFTAPIVYIQPMITAGDTGVNTAWSSATKTLADNSGLSNLIYIDCNTLLTTDDLQADGVHIKDSGYKKICNAIALELCQHYNIQ